MTFDANKEVDPLVDELAWATKPALCRRILEMDRELNLVTELLAGSFYAPQEGTDVPVFKITRVNDPKLVKWLLDNKVPRYVPKKGIPNGK